MLDNIEKQLFDDYAYYSSFGIKTKLERRENTLMIVPENAEDAIKLAEKALEEIRNAQDYYALLKKSVLGQLLDNIDSAIEFCKQYKKEWFINDYY